MQTKLGSNEDSGYSTFMMFKCDEDIISCQIKKFSIKVLYLNAITQIFEVTISWSISHKLINQFAYIHTGGQTGGCG